MRAVLYVSTIFFISAAVPVTINSTFCRFWKAVPLIDQVDDVELSKLAPVSAPTYSSQLKIIFSALSVELVRPEILPLAAITEADELVIRDLIFSEESLIVIPEAKLSVITF